MMLTRVVVFSAIVVAVLLLPGCPGAGQFIGTWILTINALDYGLTLNANGTASAFALDGFFTGSVTWESNGNVLTIHRDTGPDLITYIGSVANGATTGGWVIWNGPGIGVGGEWSAVKQ